MTPKKLPLATLQENARQLTRAALADFELAGIDALVLGTGGFEGDHQVFELYIPAGRPETARVISRAVIDVYSGAGTIEVLLIRKVPR